MKPVIVRSHRYLALLQGDLALLLAADERSVTPEHLVSSLHLMSKGCWEEADPVLNDSLEKNESTRVSIWHLF